MSYCPDCGGNHDITSAGCPTRFGHPTERVFEIGKIEFGDKERFGPSLFEIAKPFQDKIFQEEGLRRKYESELATFCKELNASTPVEAMAKLQKMKSFIQMWIKYGTKPTEKQLNELRACFDCKEEI